MYRFFHAFITSVVLFTFSLNMRDDFYELLCLFCLEESLLFRVE